MRAISRTEFLGVGLVFLLLLGGLAGCSTQNRMTHLRDTLRTFNQQIRWERWPGAAAHVELKTREHWMLSRSGHTKGLKIHDIQVLRVLSGGPRATVARVLVKLTWYREADMTVHTTHWMQTWNHSRHGWKLSKEERAQGEKPKDRSWP